MMFSPTEKRGIEVALLMDDADAGGDRLARAREMDRLAVEAQGSRVRPVDAGDDLDQRRLAGAVLAEKRVDRAGATRIQTSARAITPGNDLPTLLATRTPSDITRSS